MYTLGLLLAIVMLVLAILCLIGSVIALIMWRPLIAILLFIGFIILLILAFGIGILWVLWKWLLEST